MSNRTVRIFLSSTFRDFGEERDLLVRRVFPALRAKLRDRFVELVDVDLRWGITVQQAERGEVLPICLSEIDRARPYFIGMLGERYGWIPPSEGYAPDLVKRQPWLKKHQGGKSVTELEILHGVLNNRRMKGRAFFYFRAPAYARAKGGEYLPAGPEERQRQADLKRRVRASAYPVASYRDPEALARRLERDLWKLLDADFPATSVPDAFERETLRHEAYAASRRTFYLGGDAYLHALTQALGTDHPRILIEGESGAGKSALLANFFTRWRARHPRHVVHEHYLGASTEAADPGTLARRLVERIQRVTGSWEAISDDPQQLLESLPSWLAAAGTWARKRRTRFIIVLDGLDHLSDQQDLRWWPAFLPIGVTVVTACLPGPVRDALVAPALTGGDAPSARAWRRIRLRSLSRGQRQELVTVDLGRYNKSLSRDLMAPVLAHPLSGNPLFLRTLCEELRLFGVHEQLAARVAHYLESRTVDDLYERVLQRVEGDCGPAAVRNTMTALWAARAGLTEKELLDIAGLKPAHWAPIRNAMGEALLETSGRIGLAHDYLRIAVQDRYLPTSTRRAHAHAWLGRWFRRQPLDERRAYEEPWQWLQAGRWRALQSWLETPQVVLRLNSGLRRAEWLGYWQAIAYVRPVDLSAHHRRVWIRWSRGLPDDPVLTLASALQQALAYAGYQGQFEEKLARLAWGISVRLWGADHAHTLDGQRNLAQLLAQRESAADLEEAVRLLEQVVKAQREANSTELATTLNLLGTLLASCDRHDASHAAYEEALTRFEAERGRNDPEFTATALNNLGDLAVHRGRPQEAQTWLQRCLDIRRRSLPPDHPLLATAMDNLAKALMAQGMAREATTYFQRAFAIRSAVLGSDHPETNNTRVNWGGLMLEEGRYSEAAAMYRDAWQADVRRFGASHWYAIMDAVTCLACHRKAVMALSKQGRQRQAARALEPLRTIATDMATAAARTEDHAREAAVRELDRLKALARQMGANAPARHFEILSISLAP